MTEAQPIRRIGWSNVWVAIRFIVFGVGGVIALAASWILLIVMLDESYGWQLVNPLYWWAPNLLGSLAVLYGIGQWGRWAYLWVFVSPPTVIWAMALLAKTFPVLDSNLVQSLLVALIPLAMLASYLLVSRYYKHKTGLSE